MTYRAERFDVHFNVKVSHDMRAALRTGATVEGMGDSHFARMVLDLGLRAPPPVIRLPSSFAMVPGPVTYRSVRCVLFDLQMSPAMRTALGAGAAAQGIRVSDFARMVIDLGLAAWREQRGSNIRRAGGA